MNFYNKTLFLDQFTPVSVYQKVKELFPKEITFLFESVVNGDDGNFSYIFVFLKEYYKNLDKKFYHTKGKELGIGLIDGFIGNMGYDMVATFEPTLQKSMNGLKDEFGIADCDLIRPKIVLVYSHKTSQ